MENSGDVLKEVSNRVFKSSGCKVVEKGIGRESIEMLPRKI